MTSDTKKTKADTALKTPTAAKDKSPAADVASKPKEGDKAAEKATEKASETASETTTAAPANYSRGEGQKPVTRAYKENWNAIFAKKKIKTKTKAKTKKKKR
jgi:hypothetical protein